MTLATTDFEFISELVRTQAAIVLEPGREYLVDARLSPIARAENAASVEELINRLRSEKDGALRRRVVEAMTTNETSFFRDPRMFDALKLEVLPELIKQNATTRELTIWSAASSSGQEAYSIAILLKECGSPLDGWKVRILGTDLCQSMVERCRQGRFNQLEVNRGLPAALLVKYFTKSGVHWCVNDQLKALTDFRTMNLAQPWPPLPRMDLVLLRNVLIYFDFKTKQEILRRVYDSLKLHGYLALGGAETTLGIDDRFDRVTRGGATLYRTKAKA